MTSLPNQMYAALETAIVAALPSITEVIQAETLDEIAWGDITPPFSAILAQDPRPDSGPTSTAGFLMPVRIAVIAQVGEGTQREDHRDLLELLVLYFQMNALAFGQIMSIDGMAWGKSLEANVIFVAKNYTDRMAMLDITVRYGYQGGFP